MICVWSSWCHGHPIISCFINIQNPGGFNLFWCPLTQVGLEEAVKQVSVYYRRGVCFVFVAGCWSVSLYYTPNCWKSDISSRSFVLQSDVRYSILASQCCQTLFTAYCQMRRILFLLPNGHPKCQITEPATNRHFNRKLGGKKSKYAVKAGTVSRISHHFTLRMYRTAWTADKWR